MKSLYFDENKVQKECYKLVGISNLGEKSLKGYMKSPKFNKVKNQEGFTITEIAFLQRVAWCLEVDREQTRKILDCLFKGMPFQKRNSFTPKPLCTAKEMDGINISVFEFYDFCIKLHKYIPHLKRPMVEDMLDIFNRFNLLWQSDGWTEHTPDGCFIIAVSSWLISKRMNSKADNKAHDDIFDLQKEPALYKMVMLLGEVLNGSTYVEKLERIWREWTVSVIKQHLSA